MINNKRGVSEVVTTVLLVAISVSIFSILYIFVIDYAQKPLSLSPTSCIDIQSSPPISIDSACYNSLTKNVDVKLRRGIDNIVIDGLIISSKSLADTSIVSCGGVCSSCKILNSGESKVYYVPVSEKPSIISLMVNDCELPEVSVEKC
jgi:flagellin-like protein